MNYDLSTEAPILMRWTIYDIDVDIESVKIYIRSPSDREHIIIPEIDKGNGILHLAFEFQPDEVGTHYLQPTITYSDNAVLYGHTTQINFYNFNIVERNRGNYVDEGDGKKVRAIKIGEFNLVL